MSVFLPPPPAAQRAAAARGRSAPPRTACWKATTMTDRPLSPIGSQRRGTAKFGDTVAEVSSAGASVDEQPAGVQAFIEGCMLHVADQLYGNGCALALCALFLALGICCFTIGVFALAMNQFFLGRMLKAEHACWKRRLGSATA